MDALPLPRRRSTTRFALLVALVVAIWSLGAPRAGAHGDEGEMTVLSIEEVSPQTVAIEVGLVHADDDHLAEGAEVWVTATADGYEVEPVGMEQATDGRSVYTAEIRVPAPGRWNFEIESVGPEATATSTLEVTGAQAPVPTSSIAPTTTTLLLDGDDGIADAQDASDDAGAEDGEDGDDGLSAVVIAIGVIGLLVLLAAGFALAQRRRSTT